MGRGVPRAGGVAHAQARLRRVLLPHWLSGHLRRFPRNGTASAPTAETARGWRQCWTSARIGVGGPQPTNQPTYRAGVSVVERGGSGPGPVRNHHGDPGRTRLIPVTMSRIPDLLAAGRTWSFEFFPPKTPEGLVAFDESLEELAQLKPSYASLTYGALGSTRDTTRDLVIRANHEQTFPFMPHLTCVGHTRADLVELLEAYRAAGIENILALAGDPPADGSDPGGDFTYATELHRPHSLGGRLRHRSGSVPRATPPLARP